MESITTTLPNDFSIITNEGEEYEFKPSDISFIIYENNDKMAVVSNVKVKVKGNTFELPSDLPVGSYWFEITYKLNGKTITLFSREVNIVEDD